MPTRLAAGLGHESDLDAGFSGFFRPCLELNRGLWFPRIRPQEEGQILAATADSLTTTENCQECSAGAA